MALMLPSVFLIKLLISFLQKFEFIQVFVVFIFYKKINKNPVILT